MKPLWICFYCLAIMLIPFLASAEMKNTLTLNADLDGDGRIDRVQLVDEGKQYYRFEVQLSNTQNLNLSQKLFPAPATGSYWRDGVYQLKLDDEASFHVLGTAGDKSYDLWNHEVFLDYAFMLNEGLVTLQTLRRIDDSDGHADPGFRKEYIADFHHHKIILNSATNMHGRYSNKKIQTQALPLDCQAPLSELEYGKLPSCAQKIYCEMLATIGNDSLCRR